MKHVRIGWVAVLIVSGALLATPVLAAEHDMSSEMNHGSMQQMQDMQHMQGGMIMLGQQEVDGVKAMFHLMPVDPEVLPSGHKATHHLMVMFNDVKTGKSLDSGTVAVKITDPGQVEAKPVKLMGMQGHFGVDVNLDRPGIWHFRIATKLADGKVRQFHTHHVVK